ncbi:hypothetical protein WH47_06853, partial [Habropoda laboriosa]
HSPSSPDLTPSNLSLLKNQKNSLRGERFPSQNKLKIPANEYFEDLPKECFSRRMLQLENCRSKCTSTKEYNFSMFLALLFLTKQISIKIHSSYFHHSTFR